MLRHTGAKVEYCSAILALLFALPASAAMQPPVANAGPDRTGSVSVAITFSGAGSFDPDGSIALYSWQFGDGGAAAMSTASVTHTYTAAGTYSLSLWVKDNAGLWSTTNDVAVVTIGGGATPTTTTTTSTPPTTTAPLGNNKPPVAKAGPDQATQTLTTLTFNGSASSDPDGSIVTAIWTFGDGKSASGLIATHQYATAGTYTATLAVADNQSAVATDTARITVANRPPTANAGPNVSGAPNTMIGLNGSASSDPDGTIVTYAWTFGDGTTGSGSNPTHAYAAVGTYTASLTVTDNNGSWSTADTSVVTVASSGGSSTWARSIGGTSSDSACGVAADAAGNVFAGGTLRGSMTVGGTTLTSAGLGDWFLIKYSPTGAVLWAKRFGGTGDDALEGLAADADGNVIATGRFAGTVNFGGTPLVANGASDMVLAKYDGANGAHKWSKGFGGALDDLGTAVAVDTAKNIYLTGYFRGTVNFGGLPITVPFDTDLDAFVAKFDTNGAPGWSKHFWNSGNDRGTGIAVAGGSVALVGYFSNSINFNSSTVLASFLDAGAPYVDAFVTKLSASDGGHVWSKQIGTLSANDYAYGVAIDGTGNVVVTGFVLGSVDFGGGALTPLGGLDAYVAKYGAATGSHQWSRRFGSGQDDQAYAVALDASNNVYVAGAFRDIASFGNASLTTDSSLSDGYVAKYTAAGAPVWARKLGGSGTSDLAQDIAVGASGYPSVVGYFNGSGDFNGTPLTSAGLADGFVACVAP